MTNRSFIAIRDLVGKEMLRVLNLVRKESDSEKKEHLEQYADDLKKAEQELKEAYEATQPLPDDMMEGPDGNVVYRW